jgi:3-hydroxybutyryl-CoA dehydrogenase
LLEEVILKIQTIAVIGGGTMGSGIATVFALNGYDVALVEVDNKRMEQGLVRINDNLTRLLQKEKITYQVKEETLSGISRIVGLKKIDSDTDLIIEAVNENKELKIRIFIELDNLLKPESIIASNTSSISITELSAGVRADRFIGIHFMNPVPVMQLVELIRGYSTSDETFNIINELILNIGKVPVQVNDYPGFVANRILMPMINEAIFALMEGVASKEDIDSVMKLGMNHPMGPLTLADFIGLDVCLSILEVLYNGFNDPKYRPCPLLKKLVAANKLGRKSGEGFYKY